MFKFFGMKTNYKERVVDNYKNGDLIVDTAAVTDADQPYETGIQHPSYNNNKWVIVELYDTKEEAQTGHDKWVKTMTQDVIPSKLTDVSTCEIIKFAKSLGINLNEVYDKIEKGDK